MMEEGTGRVERLEPGNAGICVRRLFSGMTRMSAASNPTGSSNPSRRENGKVSLGCGRYSIERKDAKGDALRAAARSQFLLQIEFVAKPVLEDLKTRLLPCLEAAWAHGELRDSVGCQGPEPVFEFDARRWVAKAVCELLNARNALAEWAHTWKLTHEGNIPDWVRDQVIHTLTYWLFLPLDPWEELGPTWGGVPTRVRADDELVSAIMTSRLDLARALPDFPRFALWDRREGTIRLQEDTGSSDWTQFEIDLPDLQVLNTLEESPVQNYWRPFMERESPEQAAERIAWEVAAWVRDHVAQAVGQLDDLPKFYPRVPLGRAMNEFERDVATWVRERLLPVLRQWDRFIAERFKPVSKKETEHFVWAVRYQCLGENMGDLAERYHRSEEAVRSAVKEILDLIGLTPRRRRGRPRKAHD